MAVPSSGPLELRGDINLEVNGNVTDTNVALHQLSLDAGFSTPDAMSDFYGYTSVVLPTVYTQSAQVGTNFMRLYGCIDATGGENVSRGFYHGTSSNRTSNTKYTLGGTQGTGQYNCCRTGLSSGTTHYWWAFGCNSAGESVGSRASGATTFPPFSPSCFEDSVSLCGKAFFGKFGYPFCPTASCNNVCAGWVNPYNGQLNTTCSCSKTNPNGGSGTCLRLNSNLIFARDSKNFAGASWGANSCAPTWDPGQADCPFLQMAQYLNEFESYNQHSPRICQSSVSSAFKAANGGPRLYCSSNALRAFVDNCGCKFFLSGDAIAYRCLADGAGQINVGYNGGIRWCHC